MFCTKLCKDKISISGEGVENLKCLLRDRNTDAGQQGTRYHTRALSSGELKGSTHLNESFFSLIKYNAKNKSMR